MKFVLGVVSGLLASLVLAWLGWKYAPHFSIDEEDFVALAAVAARSEIAEVGERSTVVYVLPSELARTLTATQGSYQVSEWSQRPEDRGCERRPGYATLAPCERDDFVRVALPLLPLWRVAIVRVTTHNSGHEKLLVKVGASWRIISDTWYVI